ncbi:fasciclin domain-containing protein [Kitasatospora mediocidica]|uniref:fasciclin domain-containing protein n=1 Tax=Kitasatospora mediocidica TaxID=58352 RepID=UPI00068D2ED8|nr:fasciclin domain-containing protein [Kitasatospora mediocidica]
MRSLPSRTALAVGIVLAAVTLSGCAGYGEESADRAGPPPDKPFGQTCTQLPADGPGSMDSMGGIPVLAAIEQTKDLSTLAGLIKTAKAKDLFDSMDNVTVFAPTDEAFAKLPDAQRKTLGDQAAASDLLRRLIVVRDLHKSDLADHDYTSVQGAVLKATGSGDDYRVGGAQVLCGSIKTSNARLAMLDQVPS